MGGWSESEDPPLGVRPLKLSEDPPWGTPTQVGRGPLGGSSVVCSMFHPWSVVVLLWVGEYFDNGIVEGKGVWNERRISFRISALISANKHTSQ